jgi:hypothetical protein
MSTTSINGSSPLANKQFSRALSAMAVRQPTPLRSLTGPLPSEEDANRKIRQQTTTDMPIVRVDESSSREGSHHTRAHRVDRWRLVGGFSPYFSGSIGGVDAGSALAAQHVLQRHDRRKTQSGVVPDSNLTKTSVGGRLVSVDPNAR